VFRAVQELLQEEFATKTIWYARLAHILIYLCRWDNKTNQLTNTDRHFITMSKLI